MISENNIFTDFLNAASMIRGLLYSRKKYIGKKKEWYLNVYLKKYSSVQNFERIQFYNSQAHSNFRTPRCVAFIGVN